MTSLNQAQQQAVTSDSQVILTLAGAGTGKTAVLTRRIAHLHDEMRVGTSNMLALTFTRLAGHEMKERIAKLIGEEQAKKLFCNTFHAFCVQALRQWGERVGIEPNFTIYDPEDQEAIIKTVIKECKYKTKVDDVLHDINQLASGEEEFMSYESEQAAREYMFRLRRNNAVSLDELLTRTLSLMVQEDITAYYRNDFKYVFVDEFQDTDGVQMAIIKALAPENLFVVGDDYQSIYRFRGARVENILNFSNEFEGCETVKLEFNYRSTHEIVNAANRLIQHNQNRTDKKLIADKEGPSIEFHELDSMEAEAFRIVQKANAYQMAERKYSDIAVLARTNHQLEIVRNQLAAANVPAQVVSQSADIFQKRDIATAIRFVEYVINPSDSRALQACVNFPVTRLTDLEMTRAITEMETTGKTLEDVLADSENEAVRHLVGRARSLREGRVFDFWNVDAIEAFKRCSYELGMKVFYEAQGLQNRIEDMIQALRAINRWCRQQEQVGDPYDIQTFIKWLRIRDIQDYYRKEVDAVQLMTVHGSKGLEFDTVFMIGMNEETFPSKKAVKSEEDLEEERRLMYVAVTRAKRLLVLTRPREVTVYKNTTTPLPSRFMREMGLV
ncbi:hypothetical protein CIG75_12915 [Tumebacillus algifaecis]|uniref:DNA 3'-5' helicase n=1 Tax=Tumebacillus algifaecis TaxID=1214604 RepID=A0A223D2I5_9BACL|nr:ATP-dependent helicase [Tumebacillus algifaecis]ASS75800.1 hypothetical protein CIG75_12915 [Tumebacillus algifaecis]